MDITGLLYVKQLIFEFLPEKLSQVTWIDTVARPALTSNYRLAHPAFSNVNDCDAATSVPTAKSPFVKPS